MDIETTTMKLSGLDFQDRTTQQLRYIGLVVPTFRFSFQVDENAYKPCKRVCHWFCEKCFPA